MKQIQKNQVTALAMGADSFEIHANDMDQHGNKMPIYYSDSEMLIVDFLSMDFYGSFFLTTQVGEVVGRYQIVEQLPDN